MAVADNPVLQRGSEGEWVSYLQQLLEAAGHSPGAVDGNFGSPTEAAVRAFQEAHGQTADGVVGQEMWGALAGAGAGAGDGAAGPGGESGGTQPDGGPGAWSANPDEWTEEQRDQYFTYNDVIDEAESLDAELDVPEIDEEHLA